MNIELVRFAYTASHTLGRLTFGELRLATIERPWIPSPVHRGGLNFESCVPDGEYELWRHAGPRFPNSFALRSIDLNVHLVQSGAGRWAILIHIGNFVEDVVGCIAVGLAHGTLAGRAAVTSSAVAMNKLRAELADDPLPGLIIRPTQGTIEERR